MLSKARSPASEVNRQLKRTLQAAQGGSTLAERGLKVVYDEVEICGIWVERKLVVPRHKGPQTPKQRLVRRAADIVRRNKLPVSLSYHAGKRCRKLA